MAAPAATEIRFARRLADNDKAVRDKAVKKLRTWLHKQHGLSELDNCKLWRGLFFCMWMSDKPLVQEELADQIVCSPFYSGMDSGLSEGGNVRRACASTCCALLICRRD